MGLFGDSIALESRTRPMRDEGAEKMASQIGSIIGSLDNDLISQPLRLDERLPDTSPRQLIIATEDSRHLINRFSVENLRRRAAEAHLRRYARNHLGLECEPAFGEELEEFYHGELLSGAEAAVDYSTTHIAIVRRSLLFIKRTEAGQLVAAPGTFAVQAPSTKRMFSLTKMPDIVMGSTYSKDRTGSINHVGKIIEARLVEPHRIVWQDEQRPKRRRHKRRIPQFGIAAPGKLAANQA
jgi:hypothetical protein